MVSAVCPKASPRATTPTAAEDKPAVAVTAATADAWGGRDLAAAGAQLRAAEARAVDGHRDAGGDRDVQAACTPANIPMTQRFSLRCGRGRSTPRGRTTADPAVPDDVVVLADRKPR